MERWTELRAAYHVAKLGTVSAASRALGTHRATINRHIDVLESELGSRIFFRNAKGYVLTEFGEEFVKIAGKADELFQDLAGRAKGSDGDIQGELKLTTVLPLANLLMASIATFRQKNANCKVTVTTTEDLERLEYGEAHIALRAGLKPEHPDYVVQSLGTVSLNLYGSQSYLSRFEAPPSAEELEQLAFVMPPDSARGLAIWAWIKARVPEPKIAIEANDPMVIKEAVFAGLGLGVLSEIDAAESGELFAVLPAQEDWKIPLWLVTHVDLHRTAKVQEMLALLKESRG